jgi:hypothetical protein
MLVYIFYRFPVARVYVDRLLFSMFFLWRVSADLLWYGRRVLISTLCLLRILIILSGRFIWGNMITLVFRFQSSLLRLFFRKSTASLRNELLISMHLPFTYDSYSREKIKEWFQWVSSKRSKTTKFVCYVTRLFCNCRLLLSKWVFQK